METTPRDSLGTLRERAGANGSTAETGALTDPITPDMPQPGIETIDMKDRAKHAAQGAMDFGSKAIHAVTDKLHQFPETAETRGKGRMIAIGSMTAAGIGMAVRHRKQQAKTGPQNIASRAKEIIHSR
jgi:hypothetical protein